MTARPFAPARSRSTRFLLAAGAIAAAGFALAFGAIAPDVAQIAVPHQLALRAAQIGIAAPAAHAAGSAEGVRYLPGHMLVRGVAEEEPLPQF